MNKYIYKRNNYIYNIYKYFEIKLPDYTTWNMRLW